MTKSRFKDNDKAELSDLRSFSKTDAWNAIPKDNKEQIIRRIRWLEKKLGLDSEPYNG